MLANRFWRTVVKLACRNIQRSPAALAFTAITMAVSIASIAGINGVVAVAREALGQDTRSWLGADLVVNTGEPIDEDQLAALDRERASGIDSTVTVLVLTAVASQHSPDPGVIGVKVIDPAKYPFYGQPVPQSLTAETVAVSQNLLTQMQVRVGDEIRVGGAPFRISSVFALDPDRFMGILGLGMRCIISEAGYARTGIARSGNSVKYRILFRLPENSNLEATKNSLQDLFPEGIVNDYREPDLQTAANVQGAISFLGVIEFLTLAFSAIGVAIAARQHFERQMTTIAIMKALGARFPQMAGVLCVEIFCLLLAAVAIGVPTAFALRFSMISFARKFVILNGTPPWHFGVILGSAAASALAMLPVLLRPALAIRSIRPGIVLRRDAEQISLPDSSRALSAAALAIASLAFLAVVLHLVGSWVWAILLVAAFSASIAIAALLAKISLALAKRGLRSTTRRSPLLRLGIASLGRPGNYTRGLIVALSVGVMLIVTTFDSSRTVLKVGMTNLPYGRNSLFIAGFEESHRAALQTFLESLPGVDSVDIKTQARVRLSAVDGIPIEQLERNRGTSGSWYVAGCNADRPRDPTAPRRLTIGDDLATRLGVHPGSLLQFSTREEPIPAVVEQIRRLTPSEKYWFSFSIDCAGLTGATLFHSAEIQAPQERIAGIRSAVGARYPALPLIASEDIRQTILGIADDAARLTRLIAWYAMAAGFSILVAVVAASRTARLREIGILAALGGVPAAIFRIYTVEFAALGVLAGLIGGLLACGFTSVVISAIFHRPEAAIGWVSLPAGVLIAVPATVIAGWLPAWRLVQRKPLEVLRHE